MIDVSRLTADGRVRVRAADAIDRTFAETLYLAMTRRLLPHEPRAGSRRHFREVYRQDQSWILLAGGEEVGWVQVEDGAREVTLRQIHVAADHQGRGIGGAIVGELLEQARAEDKAVVLRVVRGNPALALYQRLGFGVVREKDNRFWMRWRPDAARPPVDVSR